MVTNIECPLIKANTRKGRDLARISPFLDSLKQVWEVHPDLRFGQLVYILAANIGVTDIFYVEDDRILESLQAFYEEKNERTS